jgi:hypothetical protein
MKPESSLTPCFAKIERAKTQIDEFKLRTNSFLGANSYSLSAKLNPKGTQKVWYATLAHAVPGDFAVIIGEILHNIRTPLDNLIAALYVQQGLSDAGVNFPFGRNEDVFKAELGKHKKLPGDALDLIAAAKPYRGGNNLLWNVHQLNRRDKHRVETIPIHVGTTMLIRDVKVFEADLLVLGSKLGQHMTRGPKGLVQPDTAKAPKYIDARSVKMISFEIPANCPIDKLDIFTTLPNAKVVADFHLSPNIALRDVEGLEREPVIAVLYQMRDLVERLLLSFERRFFP